MPEETKPLLSLAAKIAKVQADADVENLPRRNVNVATKSGGSYSYDYIEESTLARVIRPLLAAQNVAVFYSDEITRIEGNLAAVRVTLTLADGDSDARESMSTEGIGTDFGDKAVNKAKTAAMRYLLWKWFLAPSDTNPEAENVERGTRETDYASAEDVAAYLAAVGEAGFAVEPAENALLESSGGDKVPRHVLDRHRRDFEKARDKAKAAEPAAS